MKNLNSFKDDCFSFHKDVLNRKYKTKSDPDYKNRVGLLGDFIEERYKLYNDKFKSNLLEDIEPVTLQAKEINDLLNLYDFGSYKMSKLLEELTTTEKNRVDNNCKLCTIGEVNTFDHYLPKQSFPEYVVNPINLVPSCSKCNDKKSTIWKLEDKRTFLNLYLDLLPNEQYLFVKIDNDLNVEYKVENNGNISNKLYNIILSHYNRLELTKRFKENSYSVISELKTQIESFLNHIKLEDIIKIIIESVEKDRHHFGFNYWKLILKLALIESDSFLKLFNQHADNHSLQTK